MTAIHGHLKIPITDLTHLYPTGWSLLYGHTADLLCMNFCRPIHHNTSPVLSTVSTPLDLAEWAHALSWHPDRAFARYICEGLQSGFRIGFRYDSPLRSATSNMLSAADHPEVVTNYLQKEVSLGRMLGPFHDTSGLPQLHINRFGVIPKGHNTGKWRLITDLSHPQDFSVNDGIDPALCSLTYTSVDEIAETAAHLGPCALLAKVDIESAYRLIPVHPDDRPLQAVRWDNQIFVDPMLPFGLRSAPKIFNAVADALHWHLKRSGIPLLYHYLDDFIIVGPPSSTQCADSLAILDRECNRLRVPMASHKREGPTTCLIVLGIEIDTTAGHLRLPLDKLERLQLLLRQWVNKKACSRTELQSLIGLLNHAAKVVRSGRSFLRRMIDLLHAVPSSQMHIRLNAGFRADLAWWNTFLSAWNGISFLLPPSLLPAIEFTTDASGSWGCGAWCGEAWFQLQWDHSSHHLSIPEKELIPIILACASWGVAWRGCKVRCHCDNQVVVAALRSRTSKAKGVMHLLRCLVFIEAHHDCFIQPVYIDTKSNHLADDLSRNRLSSFLSKVPSAYRHSTPVSHELLDLLLNHQADWTSPTWNRQFGAIFNRV